MDTPTKDAFLSHPWAKDDLGRCTHARVKLLSGELRAVGVSTWFDEEEMIGNIDAAMASGIDAAQVVVVCLTRAYFDKVSCAATNLRQRDNCFKEWSYAQNRKKLMLPVIMEPGLRDPSGWPAGVVAMHFGGMLYVDASESVDMKRPAQEVRSMLTRMGVAVGPNAVTFRRGPPPPHRQPPPLSVLGGRRRHAGVLSVFASSRTLPTRVVTIT